MSRWQTPKRPRGGRSEAAQFYLNAHPGCEACGIVEASEVHHVITRATGGPDEGWNFLALCMVCHRVWHMIGRKAFSGRYPALTDKIKAACKRMGRKF